jgi:ferrochelatase
MSRRGVLLVNLGSPDSPSVPDVRRYLREFLMDKRVIDLAWPWRALLVYGAILPFRPKNSAEAYHSIWTPEGSPLVVSGRKVRAALERRLKLPVALGMRYQSPSIATAVRDLQQQEVEDLLLVPLFPHYAMSSYETVVVRVLEIVRELTPALHLRVLPPFGDDPDYIEALVEASREHLAHGYDHLLFSFHGIPERHLRKSDTTRAHCLMREDCCLVPSPAHATCYRAQCLATVRAFAARAAIPADRYSVAFQSRLGRDPWLQPYTDKELERFPREGRKRLTVICPAFVADCLETIEEIGIRGRETFLQAGGAEFRLVPCLNEHPAWLAALERIIIRQFTS